MTVSDELQHEITEDLASVFISDNVIRVRGGTRGGSGRIVYTVQDSMGNVSSAVLQLTVVEPDPERNTALALVLGLLLGEGFPDVGGDCSPPLNRNYWKAQTLPQIPRGGMPYRRNPLFSL